MDWNWFFSSVAQSAAAIVGIFAAFIITKIIGNETEYSKKLRLLDDMIAKSKSLKDEANIRSFKWYNDRVLEEELQKIEDDCANNGVILSPEDIYDKYNFSPYQSKYEALEIIKSKCIEYCNIKKEKELEIREKLNKLPQYHALDISPQIRVPSINARLIDKLNSERNLIENLVVKIKDHSRNIKNFRNDNLNNPESSKLINRSLCITLFLFLFGVIYPLSFLPLKVDSEIYLSLSAFWDILFSLKGFILSIISILFSSIIITFWHINCNLKYDKVKMEELHKFSLLPEYSVFLKNMEENMIEKDSL